MKRSHPFANQNGLRATRKKQVLEPLPALPKHREHALSRLMHRLLNAFQDEPTEEYIEWGGLAFEIWGKLHGRRRLLRLYHLRHPSLRP